MSKTLFGLVIQVLVVYSLSAQTPKYNPYFLPDSEESAKVYPYPVQQLGTMYVSDSWNAGKIILENGDSLIGYYMNYDMIGNRLDIIIDRKFHTISNEQIMSFEWFSGNRLDNAKFVRGDYYDLPKDEYAVAFVELLVDGELGLIKRTAVVPRQLSTSPSLVPENAQGSDLLIIEKYFFTRGSEIFEVSGRRSPNLDFIDEQKINSYVRSNRLNFSLEGDMKKVARYYNEIFGENSG